MGPQSDAFSINSQVVVIRFDCMIRCFPCVSFSLVDDMLLSVEK